MRHIVLVCLRDQPVFPDAAAGVCHSKDMDQDDFILQIAIDLWATLSIPNFR